MLAEAAGVISQHSWLQGHMHTDTLREAGTYLLHVCRHKGSVENPGHFHLWIRDGCSSGLKTSWPAATIQCLSWHTNTSSPQPSDFLPAVFVWVLPVTALYGSPLLDFPAVGCHQSRLTQNGVTYVKRHKSKLNCEERFPNRLTFPENRKFHTGKSPLLLPYRKSNRTPELWLNIPLFFFS